MKRFILTLFFCCLAVSAGADVIRIGGSGQMLPLASALGKSYTAKHPGDRIDVNPKSMGQKTGVQSVHEGLVDIATSARRLDDYEKKLSVKPYEIASVAGFFAIHPTVAVKGLTSKQICDIYAGKIKNWKEVGGPNAAIVVLTRPEDDSTKIVMRRFLPGFANLKEPEAVKVKHRTKDMVAALTSTPYSIGMIDAINYDDNRGKMVALQLDGKDITSSVTGPIQHHYNFVLNVKPSPAELRFMEFVKSPQGQAIIREQKAHPLNFNL